jgi:hypothetical protein
MGLKHKLQVAVGKKAPGAKIEELTQASPSMEVLLESSRLSRQLIEDFTAAEYGCQRQGSGWLAFQWRKDCKSRMAVHNGDQVTSKVTRQVLLYVLTLY